MSLSETVVEGRNPLTRLSGKPQDCQLSVRGLMYITNKFKRLPTIFVGDDLSPPLISLRHYLRLNKCEGNLLRVLWV